MLEALHNIPQLYEYRALRTLNFMPLFHAAALLGVMAVVLTRGTVHVLTPFDPLAWAALIEQERIDFAGLVPPVLALINSIPPPAIRAEQFRSLGFVTCGTSPLDAALERRFSEKLGGTTVKQGYGMSESTVAIAFAVQPKAGSVGKLVPNVQARLVDPATGKDAAPGKEGELWVRGPVSRGAKGGSS